MEVVVAFGEGVVGGCYDGFEEVGGFEGEGLEVEVPDEVFEDAELVVRRKVSKLCPPYLWREVIEGNTYMPDKR